MTGARSRGPQDRPPTPEEQAEITAADRAIEQLLQKVEERPAAASHAAEEIADVPRPAPEMAQGMCTARVMAVDGRTAKIAWRGAAEPLVARIAPDVDKELVAQAEKDRGTVLVECWPGDAPVIVGIVQTRVAREVVIKGETVTIDAEKELLLRSGRGAFRIRQDGDVEIVGSRIMAASRGLFRIVGRLLRLN